MRLNWDDKALSAQFYRGLKKEIKNKLARMDRPQELYQLIALATKIDNRKYKRQMERQYGTKTNKNKYEKHIY